MTDTIKIKALQYVDLTYDPIDLQRCQGIFAPLATEAARQSRKSAQYLSNSAKWLAARHTDNGRLATRAELRDSFDIAVNSLVFRYIPKEDRHTHAEWIPLEKGKGRYTLKDKAKIAYLRVCYWLEYIAAWKRAAEYLHLDIEGREHWTRKMDLVCQRAHHHNADCFDAITRNIQPGIGRDLANPNHTFELIDDIPTERAYIDIARCGVQHAHDTACYYLTAPLFQLPTDPTDPLIEWIEQRPTRAARRYEYKISLIREMLAVRKLYTAAAERLGATLQSAAHSVGNGERNPLSRVSAAADEFRNIERRKQSLRKEVLSLPNRRKITDWTEDKVFAFGTREEPVAPIDELLHVYAASHPEVDFPDHFSDLPDELRMIFPLGWAMLAAIRSLDTDH